MTNILERSIILGRPFDGNQLTVDDLARVGLEPTRSITLGSKTIYLSSRYLTSGGTLCCVAYTPNKDSESFTVRTYFLSKSQGVWRLLRRYRYETRNDHEVPTWNDKGFGEESLFLPIELQQVLAAGEPKILTEPDDLLVMYGTAVDLQTDDDYWRQVIRDPIVPAGHLSIRERGQKVPPGDVRLMDPEDAPDFSQLSATWQTELAVFGLTSARVYFSKNRLYQFQFMTDEIERSWLAGVDNTSDITSIGLRERWVKVPDLVTPAWEYQTEQIDQTGGYGNSDLRLGGYVDMYKNYLAHIPLIDEFEQAKR